MESIDLYKSKLPERILSKIRFTDSCWPWTARCNESGYGEIWWQGRMRPAHIVVRTLCKGEIPAGLELDHLCLVHPCVHPDHTEPVTQPENARRRRKTYCLRGHEIAVHGRYRNYTCRACNKEKKK